MASDYNHESGDADERSRALAGTIEGVGVAGDLSNRLSPDVFFVEGEVVFGEEFSELFFERFGTMVLALILNVGGDGVELRFAEGESAVAGLP